MHSKNDILGKLIAICDKIKSYGVSSLTNKELVFFFVNKLGVKSKDSNLAEGILSEFYKSLGKGPSYESLLQIKGIGDSRAFQIMVSFELTRRFIYPRQGYFIQNCQDIYDIVKLFAFDSQKKTILLTLSGSNELISCKEVSFRSTREIFSKALRDYAENIVVVHNHPSGSLAPNIDELQFSQDLMHLSDSLRIHITDHLIISPKGYYSFRENKQL